MTRFVTLAALSILVACSKAVPVPPIECDFDGMIVIPAGLPHDIEMDWRGRNLELAQARLDEFTHKTDVYDKSRLSKARGCP